MKELICIKKLRKEGKLILDTKKVDSYFVTGFKTDKKTKKSIIYSDMMCSKLSDKEVTMLIKTLGETVMEDKKITYLRSKNWS